MDSHGGRNPGARIVYLDASTMVPLDYEQYRMDLSGLEGKICATLAWHQKGMTFKRSFVMHQLQGCFFSGSPSVEPNITLLYKASELYGIPDLSATAMYNLTERWEHTKEVAAKKSVHCKWK